MQKITGLLQEKTLKSKNNAFLRLYLEYDILVWGIARKTNLEKKEKKHEIDPVEPFYLKKKMTL